MISYTIGFDDVCIEYKAKRWGAPKVRVSLIYYDFVFVTIEMFIQF